MRRYQGEVSRDQEGIRKYKYRKLFSYIYTTIGFINFLYLSYLTISFLPYYDIYSHHKSYETGIVSLPEILLTAVSNF